MDSGFQSFYPDGRLQFDADLSNFGFKEKITQTRTGTSMFVITVLNAVQPLVFVRGPSIKLVGAIVSGTSKTFYYNSPGTYASVTLEFYIFDKMTSGGGCGLQLFDTAGVLTFNSNQSPLIIAGIYRSMTSPSYSVADIVKIPYTEPLQSGRTYAGVLTSSRVMADVLDAFYTLYFEAYNIPGSVASGPVPAATISFDPTSSSDGSLVVDGVYAQAGPAPYLILADVTGLA
jgi:hypothetical protein